MKASSSKPTPPWQPEPAHHKHTDRYIHIGEHQSGGSEIYGRLNTETALTLDTTLNQLADTLKICGSTECAKQRRATALGLLADPATALDLLTSTTSGIPTGRRLPATLMVHIAADTITTTASETASTHAGVARVEGIGALDTHTLKRFLANSHVTIRPVIDLNTIPPVDAYETPRQMRTLIHQRNPVDVFPHGTHPAPGLDLDHTIPYNPKTAPGGHQTRPDNLGPLTRRAHRAKTSKIWNVQQP
ncbi:MAG: DUF222 domain-containing protein [Propioniciclava sp.]